MAENLPGGGSPIIRAFDSNFNFDPLTQTLLTNVNTRIQTSIFSFSSVSAELALLPNSLYGNNYLPFMVVGGINDAIPIDSISSVYRANVLFFYRSTNTDPWTSYKELWQLDQDGQLSGLVNLAKTTPRLSFGDYDSDGDLDFAVSNGHLYMAKNTIDITGMLNFTLDHKWIGPVVGLGWFFEHASLQILPAILLGLLAMIVLSSFSVGSPPGQKGHKGSLDAFLRELKAPQPILFFCICFLLQISHGPYYTFFSIYLEDFDYSKTLIVAFPTQGSCLHVLDGRLVELPGYSGDGIVTDVAPYSRIDQIDPDSPFADTGLLGYFVIG